MNGDDYPQMKTEYCLGFVFTLDMSHVWLIEKKRPEWQKGLLNGIGGHIEAYETSAEAMVREFREETSVEIPEARWSTVAILEGANYRMHVFNALSELQCKTTTDEYVCLVDVKRLPDGGVISNLHWLIPMCLWQQKPLRIIER